MGGLKLQDLNWGVLNSLSDSNQHQLTGDRRRTDTSKMLQQAASTAYSPDAIGSRDEYQGFIVSHRPVNYATYQNPGSMLQEYVIMTNFTAPAGQDAAMQEAGRYNNLAYKVYIPELNPQPAPRGADDPVLRTYPDIYSSLPGKEALPLGTLVAVKYDDPAFLRGPSIVRVVEYGIGIENVSVDKEGKILQTAFYQGRQPRALGTDSEPGPWIEGGATGTGTDRSCVSYKKTNPNTLGISNVNGSEFQTGKELHQNNWSNPPENTVSGWALPIKPGEGKASKKPNALRATSGINRSNPEKSYHKAIDIAAGIGTPLYAVSAGTVKDSPRSICRENRPSTGGNYVKYQTDTGYLVRYMHMDMPARVKIGDRVSKGQLLGYVGNTGTSTGPHLHWEIRTTAGAVLHPGDFYPPEWILMGQTTTPVSETDRSSLPEPHTPNKATV